MPLLVFPDWMLDWETPAPAAVTDTYFSVGTRGLFFDKLIGEEEPAGVTIPSMPMHLSDHLQKFQAFVSAWSIDTFFGSWLEAG